MKTTENIIIQFPKPDDKRASSNKYALLIQQIFHSPSQRPKAFWILCQDAIDVNRSIFVIFQDNSSWIRQRPRHVLHTEKLKSSYLSSSIFSYSILASCCYARELANLQISVSCQNSLPAIFPGRSHERLNLAQLSMLRVAMSASIYGLKHQLFVWGFPNKEKLVNKTQHNTNRAQEKLPG